MTKKEKTIINAYERSHCYSLNHCYKTASWYKHNAFNNIVSEMLELDGYDLRITGYNSSFFSCAYRVNDGVRTYLIYHTHTQKIVILYE